MGETTTGLIRPIWKKDHGPDPYVLRRYKQLRAMGLGIPQAAYAARQQTQEAGEMSTARQIGTAVVSEGAVPGIGFVGGLSKSIPKTAAKLADTVPPTATASVADEAVEAVARTADEVVPSVPTKQARIARVKEIRAEIDELLANAPRGSDLTESQAIRYRRLMQEAESIQFDLQQGLELNINKIKPASERLSKLSTDEVVVAHKALYSDKDVYMAISNAAAGTWHASPTVLDDIVRGTNQAVSLERLYGIFAPVRNILRQKHGDTIRLYRATGVQIDKPTTNWASTREGALQYGKNIVERDIPIDDILAVNVGRFGNYEEFVVSSVRPTARADEAVEAVARTAARAGDQDPWQMTRAEFDATSVSQQQMLDRGAGGYLSSANEIHMPVNRIEGLEPIPAMEGGYIPGRKITQPVEIRYERDIDQFTLYSGNHRVQQAIVNKESTIPAFVEGINYQDLKKLAPTPAATARAVPVEPRQLGLFDDAAEVAARTADDVEDVADTDYFKFESVLGTPDKPLSGAIERVKGMIPERWGLQDLKPRPLLDRVDRAIGTAIGSRPFRQINEAQRKLTTHMRDRNRMAQIINSRSTNWARQMTYLTRHFDLAKKTEVHPVTVDGRVVNVPVEAEVIPSLAGVRNTTGKAQDVGGYVIGEGEYILKDGAAPTMADLASRLPLYASRLSDDQLKALAEMEQLTDVMKKVRDSHLADAGLRPDVMEGGFWIPRGSATPIAREGSQGWLPRTINDLFDVRESSGGAGKASFELPTTFSSMAEGVSRGYQYGDFKQTMNSYARAVGFKSRDAYTDKFVKGITDESGRSIALTDEQIMAGTKQLSTLRSLTSEVTSLQSQKNQMTRAQAKVFESINEKLGKRVDDLSPEEVDVLVDEMTKATKPDGAFGVGKTLKQKGGIEVIGQRGARRGQTATDIRDLLLKTSDELTKARKQFKTTLAGVKRDTQVRSLKLTDSPVKGVKFHDDYARIMENGLKAERAVDDENFLLAIANNINHLQRSIGASMDLSGIGINGLLMSYRNPASTGLTMKHAFKALGDKDVLNRFFADHDKLAKQTGNLTVDEMVGEGLHLAGEGGEFMVKGPLANLRPLQASNRSFAAAGNSIRVRQMSMEVADQLKKGRTLDELRSSGDLERIADAANSMSGFTEGRAFNTLGDLALFAPRFLQARMNTVARAGRGAYYGVGGRAGVTRAATIEERMSRRAMLQMFGYATILTYGLNQAFALTRGEGVLDVEDLVGMNGSLFNPVWRNPSTGRIEPNPNFYSIKSPIGKVNTLGTYDSLMKAFMHAAQGNVGQAQSHMSSGVARIWRDLMPFSEGDWQGKPVAPWQEGGDWGNLVEWVANNYSPFAAGEIVEETITETIPRVRGAAQRGDAVGVATEVGTALGGVALEFGGIKYGPLSRRSRAELAQMGVLKGSLGIDTMEDLMKYEGYDTSLPGFKGLSLGEKVEWKDIPNATRMDIKDRAADDPELAFELERLEQQESYGPAADYYAKVEQAQEKLVSSLDELYKESIKDEVSPLRHYRLDPSNIRGDYFNSIENARDIAEKADAFPEYEKRGLRAAEDIINKVLYGDDEEFITSITGGYSPSDSETEGFNYEENERRLASLYAQYGEDFVNDMKQASMRKKFPEGHPEHERKKVQKMIDDLGYFKMGDTAAESLGFVEEWEKYQSLSTPERANMKRDSRAIRDILARSSKERARLRRVNPDLDQALLKWGYVTTPVRGLLKGRGFRGKGLSVTF